jgi:DNA-directed RNA polymerase subunit RPC12/RpoP
MFERKWCVGCGREFTASKSDQMFHSKACRLKHYSRMKSKSDIKCSSCSNRSDKYGKCELWNGFKGKTRPRTCSLIS